MKKNWFKILLLIIILIFGIYFIYFLEKKSLVSKIENCRKLGLDYDNKQKKDVGEGFFVNDGEYIYNKKLKTCIYSGSSFSSRMYYRYVVDLNTDRTIIESTYFDNIKKSGESESDFKFKERDLFSR